MPSAKVNPQVHRSTPLRERLRRAAAGELNPVFLKEMRQAVRGQMVVGMFLTALAAMFGLAAWMLLTMDAGRNGFGAKFFATLVGTLTFLTGVCISMWGGGLMLGERHGKEGIDLLYYTPMSAEEIIEGKFLSNLTLAAVFFAAGAPFLAITPLLRGVDAPTVIMVTGLLYCTVVLISQASLVLASLPVNPVWKGVLGLVACLFGTPAVLLWCGFCLSFAFNERRSGVPLLVLSLAVPGLGLLGLKVLIVMAASYIAPCNGIYFRRNRPPRLSMPPLCSEPPPMPRPE